MRIKASIFIALFAGFFYSQLLSATPQVLTSVSNNQVSLGDIFLLNINIDDSDSDYQLDISPLEKEFTVYRPSKSQRSQYINGDFTQQTQWKIRLQAKITGNLSIPVLKIGTLNTREIQISVTPVSKQATKTADNRVFMENSINKISLYIGQPLIFTTRIYITPETENLQLSGPELKDAIIEVYGQDKNEEVIKNGIRYTMITRQFQITTDTAGDFMINSPLLSGDLRKVVNLSNRQNQVIAVPLNVRGDRLQIQVKGKPAGYQGEWLVSEDVRLLESTPLTPEDFHLGDPITRTITLQIASINKDKLPTLSFNYPKGLRFYPDQDEIKEGQANGLLYAQRTMRHAIIPDQAGELTLPEIKIPWWNSLTDKQEYAVLSAQTLTILAANKQPASLENAQENISQSPAATIVEIDNGHLIYWRIISALLSLGLIILLLYHLSYRRRHTTSAQQKVHSTPVANQAYLNLQDALQKNNAPLTYQRLIIFLHGKKVNLKSLSQLTEFIILPKEDEKQFLKEIKLLEQACCSAVKPWDATQLSSLIKKHLRQTTEHQGKSIMDLNP
ncbi:protein BatD [Psychromonas sp. MB-3u-54]|uniref:BatD family protein n=1 Tax=Psychromonas sp. MB-3u-54 TaxID=2058319 RepID=UPI000C33F5EC|nr:BatD family protein [Psychromonas sp. MB-3u-54]PKH03755.1 protein BatD [Psychromonas sp. MB-3u-54]